MYYNEGDLLASYHALTISIDDQPYSPMNTCPGAYTVNMSGKCPLPYWIPTLMGSTSIFSPNMGITLVNQHFKYFLYTRIIFIYEPQSLSLQHGCMLDPSALSSS